MEIPTPIRVVALAPWDGAAGPVLAYCEASVRAGFPSPAEDYSEKRIDLTKQLVRHPAATFLVRVAGDSMTGAGIQSGDVLVVDRSERPRDGQVVVAVVDGGLTVKRLRLRGGAPALVAENPAYGPVGADELSDVRVWGVVKHVIHSF